MGADLEMFVERREGGRWVLADPAIWYEYKHYDEIEDAWWGPTEIYDRPLPSRGTAGSFAGSRSGPTTPACAAFAEQAGECFVTEILPLLRSYGDPDQHRVVFWVW
ncbi:MAG TPA: hypothetical protein VEX86_03290 [Longimicrobium sp.]|nr:hypothetical protein [Longimicrobium sp.]